MTRLGTNRLRLGFAWVVLIGAAASTTTAQELPKIFGVDAQPVRAQVRRLVDTLELLGQPVPEPDRTTLQTLLENAEPARFVEEVQEVLDPYCLIGIEINPESRVKAVAGPAEPLLQQGGWTAFLIKVQNDAGVTAPLVVQSPNAAPLQRRSTASPEPSPGINAAAIADRWMDLALFDDRPMTPTLSGLALEYRILQVASRDAGAREGSFSFNVGQGSQDLGFRSDVPILFRARPAVPVTLEILDDDGTPTMAWFEFRDPRGRVYPAQSKRLAPDMFFHPQIYRQSGEIVLLPPGTFEVRYARGPEYLVQTRSLTVPEATSHDETFELVRWVKLADRGWYSGDHHVHAAGCAHYESPTEGIQPEDMMRQILGEDLNVGCVLSWGPCWYFQKQFFDGQTHPLSTSDNLMRYDVEVSGFPSSHAGHLCLLRLTEDDYPGTTRIEEWPSWDLPVLQWGQRQGGVVGFSHSGWGLQVPTFDLPNDAIPPFDGIGANEYIVDVVHDAVDFISTVDTPAPWELNIWYHTLNCGFRTRISGETDFPCIYGERVGLGRAYVKLDDGEPLNFDNWVAGIKAGRSYVGDGRSHLVDFQVADLEVGVDGSELRLDAPQVVEVTAEVAAYLPEQQTEDGAMIAARRLDQKPYWHIERSRMGTTRMVPVELIVNGEPVERIDFLADGQFRPVRFTTRVDRSSWVALRVYPSSHTNPIFVIVDGQPIHASKRSAQWCLESVDQCWSQKSRAIRPAELDDARDAYDVARSTYRTILENAFDDRD